MSLYSILPNKLMPHQNQDVFKVAKKILVCYFYTLTNFFSQ